MPELSRYRTFGRDAWARRGASTPLTLAEDDLAALRGIHEPLDLDEVVEVYLPLARLLHDAFVDRPFLIGIAGPVAVGKSTTSRVIQALLRRWPEHTRVDLVSTDGFLFPNAVLEARGLMLRKGFPESYDTARLVQFFADLEAGADEVHAPVYSHEHYDVVPDATYVVARPDIVIIEGVNALQVTPSLSLPDLVDFSIYVDAAESDIVQWYVERFEMLRGSTDRAIEVWNEINRPNLVEHILPTRERADLVLHKGADHRVTEVWLRRR